MLALTEVETAYPVGVLGDMESSSPFMSINPLEMVMTAELNSNTKMMGFDNTLKLSNWVKHRLPGFSKIMGLSLGRHEKRCIMLLQRLEMKIEATKLVHKKMLPTKKLSLRIKGRGSSGI